MSRVLAGRKGGAIAGAKRRQMNEDAIRALVGLLTPVEAFLLGRKDAKAEVDNRKASFRREGYSVGFEAGYESAQKLARVIA